MNSPLHHPVKKFEKIYFPPPPPPPQGISLTLYIGRKVSRGRGEGALLKDSVSLLHAIFRRIGGNTKVLKKIL